MPFKSRRGRKRGRKKKAEMKPELANKPVQTLGKRGRKRGRNQKTDPKPPAMVDCTASTSTTPAPVPSTSNDYEDKYSGILPCLSVAANSDEDMCSRAYVNPTASLFDCLFGEEDKDDFELEVVDPESIDIRCCENVSSDLLSLNTTTSFEESINNYVKRMREREEGASGGKEEMSLEEDIKEQAGEGTSGAVAKSLPVKEDNSSEKPQEESRVERPVSQRNPRPKNQESARIRDLERRISEGEDLSIADIRLYKKLKVRNERRTRQRAVFDPHVQFQSFWAMIETNTRIPLDHYQYDYLNSFRTRILGSKERYCSFLSPYTKRILKPFIMRDCGTTPLWLRMMDELQRKAKKKNPTWEPPPRASIDYCYVRPHHLPVMNSLAELYFWPDINLTECLRCPDFSCVVFHQKFLLGFTIAFPDVFRNDIYIAFTVVRREWQRSGIASFMFCHVIESSKGRDLTLHVSPSNPSVILYQKFGFKVLYFEKNFYSRYLPPDSKQCTRFT